MKWYSVLIRDLDLPNRVNDRDVVLAHSLFGAYRQAINKRDKLNKKLGINKQIVKVELNQFLN